MQQYQVHAIYIGNNIIAPSWASSIKIFSKNKVSIRDP